MRDMRAEVLDNLELMMCEPDGTKCAPATAAERADPPVSMALAERAVRTGFISAQSAVCGLDWREGIFGAFMTGERGNGRTERQMAMLGGLHGYAMHLAERVNTDCDPDTLSQMKALMR